MGIQVNTKFKGLPVPEAYFRVEQINGGKRDGWHVNVTMYASEATANPPKEKVGTRQVEINGRPVVNAKNEAVMEDLMQSAPPAPLESFGFRMPYVADVNVYQQAYAAAKEFRAELKGGTDV